MYASIAFSVGVSFSFAHPSYLARFTKSVKSVDRMDHPLERRYERFRPL